MIHPITKQELIEVKEYLENIKLNDAPPATGIYTSDTVRKRAIFKGDTPSLLIGKRWKPSENKAIKDKAELKEERKNPISYLDGTIGRDRWQESNNNYHFFNMLQDQELIDLIRQKHINTITETIMLDSGQIGKKKAQRLLAKDVNSSYNFNSETDFALSLTDIAEKYGFETSNTHVNYPFEIAFPLGGFKFTESIVEKYFSKDGLCPVDKFYYRQMKPKRKKLSLSETWPYTMQATFTTNDKPNLDQMIKIYNILYEHILYIQNQIEAKGIEHAFTRSRTK